MRNEEGNGLQRAHRAECSLSLLPLTVFSFLLAILNILLYKKVYIITFNGGSSGILLLYIGGCYIYPYM